MSKITKAWVESQIEKELERGNHPDAIRDLAALVTVHEYICPGEDAIPAASKHPTENHAVRAVPVVASVHKHHDHETLSKEVIMEWVDSMEDADGVKGGKYTWHQAQQHAMNKGITDEWRMLEMYAAMNAMYADYHYVAKKFGVDREDFYACMAKAFIDDVDAAPGKLARYYKYIARHGSE